MIKRLPIMFISAGLLSACGTSQSGALGPVPTGLASPAAHATGEPAATRSPIGSVAAPVPGATPPARAAGQMILDTWFTRQGKLYDAERAVPATPGAGRAALERLLAGPADVEYAAGLRTQIPPGTELLGLRINDAGTALVDLSPAFVSAAGASTMPLRIAQVVYTLTQFPTVASVRFELSGHGVTVLGEVPVQGPQTRAMYDGYLPPITVRSPGIGEHVSSPVTVSGTADVFEAVVSVRVLDSAGNEIARTFGTASCGTGCRGDYSVPVTYTVARAQPGMIEVSESSPQTGQPVNVQLIPVTLTP